MAGLEWFVRNPNVPEKLWPAKKPENGTCALELLRGATTSRLTGDIPAEAWFDHRSAERHYIQEDSFRTGHGNVLTLLWWKNEQMLIDVGEYEEEQAARRSDRRPEE